MNTSLNNKLTTLSLKLEKLNSARPLSKETLKSIMNDLRLKYNYHSNAIEGNTMTIFETKVVLENGATVSGKSLREHVEILNHDAAIDYLIEIVQNKEELSERLIKDIHSIIMRGTPNVEVNNIGKYRMDDVRIVGSEKIIPPSYKLNDLMSEFIEWYNKSKDTLNPVELAAQVHSRFVNIHPFIDGNGRTSRIIMNLELMKNGYPLTVIKVDDRKDYYASLEASGDNDNYDEFINFVADNVDKTLDIYLQCVKNNELFNQFSR